MNAYNDEKRVSVKAALGNELRRFQFEGCSFVKLLDQLKEVFKLDAGAPFSITYKDDEGDKITMSSDGELKEAMTVSPGGILRLDIALKSLQVAAMHVADAEKPETVEKSQLQEEQQRWRGQRQFHLEQAKAMKERMTERRQQWLERKFARARAAGKLIARHVKDVTIADGTELPPNTPFVKTWRVRNEGAEWPAGCILMSVGHSDRMNGPESVPLPGPVAQDQEVDISVPLTSPAEPGRYVGYWRLCAPDGHKFGQRLWVSIVVSSPSSSSSDESANANTNPSAADQKFEELATQVEAMGFAAKRKCIVRMLHKFDGDVEKVVQVLTKRHKGLKH